VGREFYGVLFYTGFSSSSSRRHSYDIIVVVIISWAQSVSVSRCPLSPEPGLHPAIPCPTRHQRCPQSFSDVTALSADQDGAAAAVVAVRR